MYIRIHLVDVAAITILMVMAYILGWHFFRNSSTRWNVGAFLLGIGIALNIVLVSSLSELIVVLIAMFF